LLAAVKVIGDHVVAKPKNPADTVMEDKIKTAFSEQVNFGF
jgi:hypothetical protein